MAKSQENSVNWSDFGGYAEPSSNEVNWSEFGGKADEKHEMQKQSTANDQLTQIRQQHPYLAKIAEQVAQHPMLRHGLEQTNKYLSNPIIQGSHQLGLPIAAEHTLTLPRLIASTLTGYDPHASTKGVNPYIAEGAKGIGQGLASLTGGKALSYILPMLKPEGTGKKIEQINQELAHKQQILEQLKAQAAHNFGSSKPERLELKGEDLATKLREAQQRQVEIGNQQPGPMQPSEMIKQNAMKAMEQSQEAIREFGGEGQNFPKRINEAFMSELRGNKNPETGRRENGYMQAIGNRYDTLSNKLQSKNVTLEKTPDTTKVAEWIEKEYADMPVSFKDKALTQWAKEATKSETINAANFLRSYRDLKHQVNKAYDKAYTHGMAPEVSHQWELKAQSMKEMLQKMGKTLNEQLGGQYLGELKNIDKQYSTHVAPLHENPIYQALKNGKPPSNLLQELTLDRPGNNTLRLIAERNPEIQRLLFGEQFAGKPEKLLQPSEVVKDLSQLNPKISKLISEQKFANERLEPQKELAAKQAEYEKINQELPRWEKELKDLRQIEEDLKDQLTSTKLTKEKKAELLAKQAKNKKLISNMKNLAGISSFIKFLKPL